VRRSQALRWKNAALPVKRIDGLQAYSLDVNVAFAGTPAADELLTNGANAYPPVPLTANASRH
jgi:hypothetical protein